MMRPDSIYAALERVAQKLPEGKFTALHENLAHMPGSSEFTDQVLRSRRFIRDRGLRECVVKRLPSSLRLTAGMLKSTMLTQRVVAASALAALVACEMEGIPYVQKHAHYPFLLLGKSARNRIYENKKAQELRAPEPSNPSQPAS